MTKEIIVNAGEMESRVAILENGRLMELHVERDPKIVGNIYKGRVTKVLKGMDAAFVDIGVERNAFLSASDVIPMNEEAENGRTNRVNTPPITQLLRANQEILVQVVRAPMGTKGARITTRLSIPGRYMVLMLNSGNYIGVSRKIEDSKERARLRSIANSVRPEHYSLIVRTEAEGKSEEELQQDLSFLMEMARRIEGKATHSAAPALVHGDMTLIFRTMRDTFTRDVNRVVVDSPSTYENVQELVGMIAPGLRNRIFLYDEPLPVFHAYNVEAEIERTLRRKVWLPSGGYLIIDQTEALIAIDVNTGRFVGSVELSETVLTTNLQAAEEVARQLRLRDLGGIVVVDFIDMDNPRHRAQVMKAFEEALHRDRAKIKVHNISALGLVEMTRKRTGESLAGLLTEPCPYCSGIGRIQNPLSMALRVQRELMANAVEHPEAEAFLLRAHPRIIAGILGYEGEGHHDLEQLMERPVYIRSDEQYHPNTYHIERLMLEQALVAVPHLEEDETVEAQVVNPDPDVSLSPLVMAKGMYIVVPDLDAPVGARVKVRVSQAGTSVAFAIPLAEAQRGIRMGAAGYPLPVERPALVPESLLPNYLREELAKLPPSGLPLLSPTAEAVPVPVPVVPTGVENEAPAALADTMRERRKRKRRRGKNEAALTEGAEALLGETPETTAVPQEPLTEEIAALETEADEFAATVGPVDTVERAARRRRHRRGRGRGRFAEDITGEQTGAEGVLDVVPESVIPAEALTEEPVTAEAVTELVAEETPEAGAEQQAPTEEEARPARRRRRPSRRKRTSEPAEEVPALPEAEAPAAAIAAQAEPAEEAAPAIAEVVPGPQEPELTVETPIEEAPVAEPIAEAPVTPSVAEIVAETVTEVEPAPAVEEAPKPRRRTRTSRRTKAVAASEVPAQEAPSMPELPEAPAPEPAPTPEPATAPETTASAEAPAEAETEAPKPRRRTTRRRTKKTETPAETPAEVSQDE